MGVVPVSPLIMTVPKRMVLCVHDFMIIPAWHNKPALTEVGPCRQGWWAWGMSALGYPPAKGIGENPLRPEGLPSGFTEADMQELRTALSLDSFDHQHGTDSKESARKLEIGADVKVPCLQQTLQLLTSLTHSWVYGYCASYVLPVELKAA